MAEETRCRRGTTKCGRNSERHRQGRTRERKRMREEEGESEEEGVCVQGLARSIRSFARSLARQQRHHKTSLFSGNFSGIVTVNNVHLTFSFSLLHIVNPSHFSLSIIKHIEPHLESARTYTIPRKLPKAPLTRVEKTKSSWKQSTPSTHRRTRYVLRVALFFSIQFRRRIRHCSSRRFIYVATVLCCNS